MSFRHLLLALLILLSPVEAYAQGCGDLVLEVRDLQSRAFNEYHQLNDMKQDSLLILYGRERDTCPEEVVGIAESTRDFILDFSDAYNLSKSPAEEDRLGALQRSLTLVVSAEGLSGFELGVESEDVASSARQSVQTFLEVQGKAYFTEAEGAEATRDRIRILKLATAAYEAAGENLEAENLRLNWAALEKGYLQDMEKADSEFSSGESKYSRAEGLLVEDIFSRIDAYILGREASMDFSEALVYYRYHWEAERVRETEDRISIAEATMEELKREISQYFFISSLALLGVSMFLVNRLKAWNRDAYDYSLGNELVRVSSDET